MKITSQVKEYNWRRHYNLVHKISSDASSDENSRCEGSSVQGMEEVRNDTSLAMGRDEEPKGMLIRVLPDLRKMMGLGEKCVQAQKYRQSFVAWVKLAPSSIKPQEREFVVDSARIPTAVVTANGEVQRNEEAQVYVHDLDLFVTVQIFDDTPAVLSFGKLCEEHGYSYEWASGQKPHLGPVRHLRRYSRTHEEHLQVQQSCEGDDEALGNRRDRQKKTNSKQRRKREAVGNRL